MVNELSLINTILQPINATENRRLHNSPDTPQKPLAKRGRKHRDDLPKDLIRQWNTEGSGCKAIASRLKREWGILVHPSTIHRMMAGERL
jgi:hypothetical protein